MASEPTFKLSRSYPPHPSTVLQLSLSHTLATTQWAGLQDYSTHADSRMSFFFPFSNNSLKVSSTNKPAIWYSLDKGMVVCFTETVSHTIPITALTTVLLLVLFHRQFLGITVESQDPAFIICVEGPGTKTRVLGCPMGDGDGPCKFLRTKNVSQQLCDDISSSPPPPHTHTLILYHSFHSCTFLGSS